MVPNLIDLSELLLNYLLLCQLNWLELFLFLGFQEDIRAEHVHVLIVFIRDLLGLDTLLSFEHVLAVATMLTIVLVQVFPLCFLL